MTKDMERVESFSEKLKALSHLHRLQIIHDLTTQARNVTTIQKLLGIPQSKVSAHLIKLKAAGLIKGDRSGQEIFYKFADNKFRDLISSMLE